jgi:hypothetical protein
MLKHFMFDLLFPTDIKIQQQQQQLVTSHTDGTKRLTACQIAEQNMH